MDGSLGTIDIARLRDDDTDDSQDELEEEEERQRELKGILSEAFDDVSSIDDEDDENSTEFRSIEARQVPRSALLHIKKKFTSTPTDNNNVLRVRPHPNVSVIEEEPNSIHSLEDEEKASDDVTSVERGREADQQNESLHLRLLMDQNKQLNSEKLKLQHLYDSVTGDFEGVSYKCQRLEEVLSEKDKLVDELMGKMTAMQINLQSAKDAQSVTSNKLVIAESTISSLRNELKEMHQSDSVERIRVLYESQLAQLKEKYETERSGWMDERESFKEKIDEQKHQISKLKIELDLRLKKAASDRRSSCNSDLTAKKLEHELESTRDNNRKLGNKLTQLQASLLQIQTHSSTVENSLSSKEREGNQLKQDVLAKDQQIQSQASEVVKLNNEIKSMADSLKQLETRLAESRMKDEIADKSFRIKMEQKVVAQVEDYKNQIQERYQTEFTSRLREIRDAYSKQQQQLECCVEKICSWIEGLAGQALKPQDDELFAVFDPVIKIWFSIEKKMDQQLKKMLDTRKQIEDAKQELEQAYVDSKSEPRNDDDPLLETVHQELRDDLKKAKDEIGALKEKVDKYKKNYTMQVKKFAGEREQLKQDYAALIRSQVSEVCKGREEQVMTLLSRDSRQLLQQINQAYSASLKNLKEQHDRFFEESSGKSLKKMGDAIIAYHEIVTKKITQRSRQLARQINETFCEADGGDVLFIRESSAVYPPSGGVST